MATLEQIINEARALAPAEKRRLRQVLDQDLENQASQPTYRTYEREHAWVEAHRDEYPDEWVAVDGDRLVAHGTNPRQVYLAARDAGIEVPYIVRVHEPEEPFTGGWS